MFAYALQLAAFVAQSGNVTKPALNLSLTDGNPDTVTTLGLLVKGTLTGGSSPTAKVVVQTSHNGTDWFDIATVDVGGSAGATVGATLDIRCLSRVRVALTQTGGATFDGLVVLGCHVPLKVTG